MSLFLLGVVKMLKSVIQKNEKIIANFIQKMAKRKLPFNDFLITKATALPYTSNLLPKVVINY